MTAEAHLRQSIFGSELRGDAEQLGQGGSVFQAEQENPMLSRQSACLADSFKIFVLKRVVEDLSKIRGAFGRCGRLVATRFLQRMIGRVEEKDRKIGWSVLLMTELTEEIEAICPKHPPVFLLRSEIVARFSEENEAKGFGIEDVVVEHLVGDGRPIHIFQIIQHKCFIFSKLQAGYEADMVLFNNAPLEQRKGDISFHMRVIDTAVEGENHLFDDILPIHQGFAVCGIRHADIFMIAAVADQRAGGELRIVVNGAIVKIFEHARLDFIIGIAEDDPFATRDIKSFVLSDADATVRFIQKDDFIGILFRIFAADFRRIVGRTVVDDDDFKIP